jgi:ribosomal protein S18 acetylase RimI-like enzyme
MTASDDLLDQLERYYDSVPRTAARAEDWHPFTLFVREGPGWPYYARPSLGAREFAPADVVRVRQRQRELGIPEAFEWVAETTPGVARAVAATELPVAAHPLMVLAGGARSRRAAPAAPASAVVRLVRPDDDLARIEAAADIGFGAPGTATGSAGIAELDRRAAARPPAAIAVHRERLRAGHTVSAAAFVGSAPVCVGSHQPVDGVTEIVGVATLPAFRRRGLAAAVVDILIADALRRGARTIFLSAGDETIARIYARAGFHTIGTACTAEAAT